ncbi:amino acid transporter heavy chain SLC3A2-like [Halichoeres trimaculatus]|uniref:amino acid transporter heavy chain SLC3A2-like n=1 Tax=Halichoeres trimaculatus TaxID=147232 RepID=UPI003D9F0D99
MNADTDEMKAVELNELDPEEQPMTEDHQETEEEKNGSTKLKAPGAKFTGLSKEELIKVAGTPCWVRTRCVLLILFWLGWVGMLAGAIVALVQAPLCKSIPDMSWWNEGPLYQISDVEAFSGGLYGVAGRLDEINQLKVKGLVLGPLHVVQQDEPLTLDLKYVRPFHGSEDAVIILLERAHRKGISVILDLTPNYLGEHPWFSSTSVDGELMEQAKAAAEFWLDLGFDGIMLPEPSLLSWSDDWWKLKAAIQGNRTDYIKKKVLMGVVNNVSAEEVFQLINTTGFDLILSDLLSQNEGRERIKALEVLSSQRDSVAWGLGASQKRHLSESTDHTRLYQLLLLTMPGTPVFTYGDEIGLSAQGSEPPEMIWDTEEEEVKGVAFNETAERRAEQEERAAVKKWFKSISELRVKERSLLHGNYYSLYSSESSLAFLRQWEESARYITAVNWGSTPEKLTLTLKPQEGVELPKKAKVKLSTDESLKEESSVSLNSFTLAPGQSVLLQFPYTG